jgi:hypothetical protein
MPGDGTVTLWRCRECGKWSPAKRDPIRHQRSITEVDAYGNGESRTVVCGPFDRYMASRDMRHIRRKPLPNLGEVLETRDLSEDPNAGIEVPF